MKLLNLKQTLRLKRLHKNLLKANKVMYTTDYTITTNSGKRIFKVHGYRLPFKDTTPSKCFLKNNKSALKNSDFVKTTIKQLLSKGKIEECPSAPFCVNPLSVVEGKKKRLVLDLYHVNKFLFIPNFNYKDLFSLSQVFAKDDWFFNWDLKSGYHHVNKKLKQTYAAAANLQIPFRRTQGQVNAVGP